MGIRNEPQARVLCIDPGKSMGWATLHDVAQVQSGVLQLKGDLDSRLGEFYLWLKHHLPTTALLMERPQGLQGHAVESQVGMIGIARALCEVNSISFIPVSPSAVKKTATGSGKVRGKGKVTKADMVAWAKKKYGRVMPDDEADALALIEFWRGIV